MKRVAILLCLLLVIVSLSYFVHFLYASLLIVFFFYVAKFLRVPKKEMAICIVVASLFFIRMLTVDTSNVSKINEEQTRFYIEVVDQIKLDGNRLSFLAKDVQVKEKLLVNYYFSSEKEKQVASQLLKIGHVYQVVGSLKEPASASNQHAFDYKNYLYRQQIHWQLQVEQFPFKQFKENKTFKTILKNIRKEMVDQLVAFVPDEIEGVFIALVLGERFYIEEELTKVYEKLGVVHLLAISGLHVTLLFGMIYFVCIRVGIVKEWTTNFLLILLPVYAILTGLAPSVVRACAMLFVLLLAQKTKWKIDGLLSLCVVFIFYVFLQPYVICNIGFQLSFLITACIILSSSIISRYAHSPFHSLVTVTFICQLCSLPIQIFHFYEFSFASFLANFLLIPIFSWVYLPLFTILTVLHQLNFRMTFFYEIITPIISFLDEITYKLASLDFLCVTIGTFPPYILFILYACTFLFFIRWDVNKNAFQSFTVVVCLYVCIALFNKIGPIGEVTMIDVGQGDSMYIDLPFNQGTYLIDTGGTIRWQEEEWKKRKSNFEVGADVVTPFLKSKGTVELDKLIITHFDYDHVGGVFSILENIKVSEVVIPAYHPPNEIKTKLLELCNSKNIKISYVKQGDYWKAGNNHFYILNPYDEQLDANNSSIVIYANIGNKNWLLMGDAEEEVENRLSKVFESLPIDVLKVGHHGSQSSTTELLLNSLRVKQAWVSVGKNNRYGHPSTAVLDRLDERNIKILQTNKNGGISYFFLGNRGTFWSKKP